MDIGRAFSFVFQDPKWLSKVIIGGVLVLIPIFGWLVVFGYSIRIMRNVVAGADVPLPEWDDFGGMFVDGLKAFLVGLVWSIPALIISAIFSRSDNILSSCVSSIVSAATNMFVLSATVNFARSGNLEDGFQFQVTINRVISNIGDYIIIFFLGFVLAIIAAAGLIGLCIGILFTIFYTILVNAHLGSQAYGRSIGTSTPPTQQAF